VSQKENRRGERDNEVGVIQKKKRKKKEKKKKKKKRMGKNTTPLSDFAPGFGRPELKEGENYYSFIKRGITLRS